MEQLISINNLSFKYPHGKMVFDKLNFSFNAQDRMGLIGKNGSGKTTLLQLIMGLLKPNNGTIQLFGKTCKTEKEFQEVRMKIGFVFQDANDQLFCPTVEDDLAFGPLNMGKTRQEADSIVDNVLQKLNMATFKNRTTHSLSDGEKKLIAIGTAFAMEPTMLILDEPTTCLDDDACDKITNILCTCNIPYIIVAHDKNFLKQVTTKQVVLKNGLIQT